MLPKIELKEVTLEKSCITVGAIITETRWPSSVAGGWIEGKYIKYVTMTINQLANDVSVVQKFNFADLQESDVIETIVNGDGTDSKKYYKKFVFVDYRKELQKIQSLSYNFTITLDFLKLASDYGLVLKSAPPSFTSTTSFKVVENFEYLSGFNIQDFVNTATLVEQRMLDYTVFDNMTYHPKDVLSAYNPSNVGGFFSPLLLSVAENKDIRFLFFVNLRNILLECSNYKSLLTSSEETLKTVLQKTKIVSLRVVRNRIGFSDVEPPVLVIAGNEAGAVSTSATLKPVKIATVSTYPGLLSYEVTDSALLEKSFGDYRYSVELIVDDGSVTLLKQQRTILIEAAKSIREYVSFAHSEPKFLDLNMFFTSEFAAVYEGKVQPWVQPVMQYLRTLKYVTTISDAEINKLLAALKMLVSVETGSLSGVEYFVRLLENMTQTLQDLSLYQRIDLLHDFSDASVNVDKFGEPSVSYLENQDVDGLLVVGNRMLVSQLSEDTRSSTLKPHEINVNGVAYNPRSAAMNYSDLALEFTLQTIGYEDLETWASSIGLGFADVSGKAIQATEKAAYLGNMLLKKPLTKGVSGDHFVNIFVRKLLKLPENYATFLQKFGLIKDVQVLVDFGQSTNRMEPRALEWKSYTPQLFEQLRGNGLVLCRLVSSKSFDAVTIYNMYFLMQ